MEGDALLVEVGDDGVGPPPGNADPIREGHGLGNVRQRLETMYRERGSIRLLAVATGRGAVVRLRLPVTAAAPPIDEVPPSAAALATGPAAEQPS